MASRLITLDDWLEGTVPEPRLYHHYEIAPEVHVRLKHPTVKLQLEMYEKVRPVAERIIGGDGAPADASVTSNSEGFRDYDLLEKVAVRIDGGEMPPFEACIDEMVSQVVTDFFSLATLMLQRRANAGRAQEAPLIGNPAKTTTT